MSILKVDIIQGHHNIFLVGNTPTDCATVQWQLHHWRVSITTATALLPLLSFHAKKNQSRTRLLVLILVAALKVS